MPLWPTVAGQPAPGLGTWGKGVCVQDGGGKEQEGWGWGGPYEQGSPCSLPGGLSEEDEEELCAAGFPIVAEDFGQALEQLQAAHSQAVGAPKVQAPGNRSGMGQESCLPQPMPDAFSLPIHHPDPLSVMA